MVEPLSPVIYPEARVIFQKYESHDVTHLPKAFCAGYFLTTTCWVSAALPFLVQSISFLPFEKPRVVSVILDEPDR